MKVNVYDRDISRIGIIYNWVSLLWCPHYNTIGTFTLEVQQSSDYGDILKAWNYLTMDGDDHVMVITAIQIKDGKIIATGFTAEYILSKRASTRVISNTNGENAIRTLVGEMVAWDNFELGASAGLTIKYKPQISRRQLSKYLEEIAQECDFGFKTIKDGNKLKLIIYKPGLNENAKFSQLYNNITNESYSFSANENYNVAIVAGEFEEAPVIVTVGDTSTTGTERMELYTYAEGVEVPDGATLADYTNIITQFGKQKLTEQIDIESVSFNLTDDSIIQMGDIVTVQLVKPVLRLTVRITSITTKSQNNITEKTIGVGTPIITRRS